jgi:uncharacterized protein YfaS (alpha-2-macroglobulin family)
VIASHDPSFSDKNNVVQATLVWVTRLAIVSSPDRRTAALAGHVVDIASGEPVAGATVKVFVRQQRLDSAGFVERGSATTDTDGRYELAAEQGSELLLVATATIAEKLHSVPTDSLHVWRQDQESRGTSIVLVTDRGIHRPGQTVFYKGIAGSFDHERRDYHALAKRATTVTLRDANGREVAKAEHVTNDVGSFHGSFPIATGALPGQCKKCSRQLFAGSIHVIGQRQAVREQYAVSLGVLAVRQRLDQRAAGSLRPARGGAP